MIFFFPIGHQESQTRKAPLVTIGLILLCCLIFAITDKAMEQEQKRENGILKRISTLKVSVYFKYHRKQGGDMITALIDEDASNYRDVYAGFKEKIEDSWLKFTKGIGVEADDPDLAEYKKLKLELDEIKKNGIIGKFGLVPDSPTFQSILTSMLLHGSLAHLLVNMIFLYLFGFALEDVWGKVGYLAFFIIAGFAAAGAHIAMNIGSQTPAIGASGAVSGLMGGFLIRFFKVKIDYVYYYFLLKLYFGKFSVPAYLALPLWLGTQLLYASLSAQETMATAFWAHIGGFSFGVLGAYGIIVTGLGKPSLKETSEERLEELREMVPVDIVKGVQMTDNGQYGEAAAYFAGIINKNPGNLPARYERIRALFTIGNIKIIEPEIKSLVKEFIKADNLSSAAALVHETSQKLPEVRFAPLILYKIGLFYEKEWQNETAISFYLCAAYQKGPMTGKAFLAAARLIEVRMRDKENAVKLLKLLMKLVGENESATLAGREIARIENS